MARLKVDSTVGVQPIESQPGAQAKADKALSDAKSYVDTRVLDNLADVIISSPNNSQVVQYNGANWVNATLNLTTTLSSLSDATISSPTANQYLMYNGTNWVNSALPVASTTVAGVVQLNDTINSTSITQAATANAVKSAYDLANAANGVANAALPKTGGTMTGTLTAYRLILPVGTNLYA